MALQDPTDDDVIYVGIEKTNITTKLPAVKWRKSGTGAHWKVTDTGESVGLTITELFVIFTRDADERTTDKWTDVVLTAGANGGLVTRGQIIGFYDDSPDPTKTADKAIGRWRNMTPPRLIRVTGQRGTFEVVSAGGKSEPPATPRDPHHGFTGGMGSKDKEEDQEPPEPPAIKNGGQGGKAGGNHDCKGMFCREPGCSLAVRPSEAAS
jgi:hypothetical protein